MTAPNMPGADALIDEAMTRTGLSDFGGDSFHEGLDRLTRAIREEGTLSDIGEFALPEMFLKHLTQRLQIEDWYRRHPEIDDEEIARPLIGLGLPRTGSTALSILLAQDPGVRFPRRWETGTPCPPPATVEAPDPRIAAAEVSHEMQDQVTPRLSKLVPGDAHSPAECQDFMALDFRAQFFQSFAHVPSYSDWVIDADLTSTYRYERRALKLLQWGGPTRPWRLKCPSHLLWLDALDEVFPDARFVMTHRDPADVMVSVCDVYDEVARMFSPGADPHYLGRLNVRDWTTGMQRLLRFRDGGADDRFFDIDFRAMQTDPVAEVQRLYDWLGEPLSAEFEAAMVRWWDQHAANRETNIHPDASAFGLDLDAVREQFADYTARIPGWLGSDSSG